MAIKKNTEKTRWTFIRNANDGRQCYGVYRCVCGVEKTIYKPNVNRGLSRSCGCLAAESRKVFSREEARTYTIWITMIKRCENPKDRSYPHYGGRGIKVCDRWRDFRNFIADLGIAPDGLTLERNEVNGDYTPENCRWATMLEQQNNRTNNRKITFRDKTLTLAQWARETGLNYRTIAQRLLYGWGVERALTTPVCR